MSSPDIIKLKQLFILVLLTGFAVDCTKRIDDTNDNNPCTDSCTVVQGRFITGNNEPVAGVPVEIKSEITPTLGLGQNTIRKIATGKTDKAGFYSLKFGLNEQEYGVAARAVVSLHFKYDQSRFQPINWYENFGTDEIIGPFLRKDTVINATLYLPSKGTLNVRLENFTPAQTGDYFSVITSCGAGLERRQGVGNNVRAAGVLTEASLIACGNEPTKVFVRGAKNGVVIEKDTTVLIPTGQSLSLSFSY